MNEKNKPFGVHTVHDMFSPNCKVSSSIFGWVAAVCLPYDGNKIRAAWWVLTGRAYAVVWPKDGDIEAAIGINATKRAAAPSPEKEG